LDIWWARLLKRVTSLWYWPLEQGAIFDRVVKDGVRLELLSRPVEVHASL